MKMQSEGNENRQQRFITAYEENGVKRYRVYVNLVSKRCPGTRVQKRVLGIRTMQAAVREKDRLLRELSSKLVELESLGLTWGELVLRWEGYWKKYPSRRFNDETLRDHVSRMRNWTNEWWGLNASQITVGDARGILKRAYENGASLDCRSAIRGSMNKIFQWALEEQLVQGMSRSPALHVEILCEGESRPEEKRPEILNAGQISRLLHLANSASHPWHPIWFMGFYTGMRSGELQGLRKGDIELVPVAVAKELDSLDTGDPKKNYGVIHVQRAWNTKEKVIGPVKARYWRDVPINSALYWWLVHYLPSAKWGRDESGEKLFEDIPEWKRGEQAKVLRNFCEFNQLESVKFHTIRACFATMLLGMGVSEAKVMKVGGWRDLKTMQRYIRLAGINEYGATEALHFASPTEGPTLHNPNRHMQVLKADDDRIDEALGATGTGGAGSNVIAFDFRRKK